MKKQPTLLWVMLLLIAFGCDDLPIGFENNIGPSVLSGKPPILKISYTEVAHLSFVEHSDIFFEDYIIIKNKNFTNNH